MNSNIRRTSSLSKKIENSDSGFKLDDKILVLGVGGAGSNAVERMLEAEVPGIEFCIANTDAQALQTSKCPNRIQLGPEITMGLGAGADADVGRVSAEESMDEVQNILNGVRLLFIVCGMGGGTGTGASPVVAQIAHSKNILTVAMVTKPFDFEGSRRMRVAEAGIEALEPYVNSMIVMPNQNAFRVATDKTTFEAACALSDEILKHTLRSITGLIKEKGLINLDFADVKSVMSFKGRAMVGVGEASGENRGSVAAEQAIHNPLLDDTTMERAQGILVNVTGANNMTLFEIDEVVNRVKERSPDALLIFGAVYNNDKKDVLSVTVIATGLDHGADVKQKSPVQTTPKLSGHSVPWNQLQHDGNFHRSEAQHSLKVTMDSIASKSHQQESDADRIAVAENHENPLYNVERQHNSSQELNEKRNSSLRNINNTLFTPPKKYELFKNLASNTQNIKENDDRKVRIEIEPESSINNSDEREPEKNELDSTKRVEEISVSDARPKKKDFFDIPSFLRRKK
ncbi:Cell division protein FtsZ [Candidatus Fokinia solitaria]|uniref:Cell division protein FtsZ n=1 Tax=Candidatus Fokinia solitaria TaxID=1802984 RepID=A0A2U8BRF9_9RICK|nr:cell division protein FtsZ [Candidatus Fokinia solitaria]AWD32922.1 Cell division protein FtsZ [Candidatus Fokinia solitaria]